MSMFTSKMKLLSAVVIDDKTDVVTKALLKLGVLDFVKISKLFKTEEFNLKDSDDSELVGITELRRRLETIYKQAGIKNPNHEILTVEQMTEYNSDLSRNIVEKVTVDLQTNREKQKKLHQEMLKLNEIIEYLSASVKKESGSKFLNIHKGHPSRGDFEDMLQHLSAIPHFGTQLPETSSYYIVSLRRDQSVINETLEKYSWIEDDLQMKNERESEEIIKNINIKADKLKASIDELRAEMKSSVISNKEKLDSLWKNLRLHELYGSIRNNFSHTERTSLFSGWLPVDKAMKVEESIRTASGGECIIEWSEAEAFNRKSVPVEIKHVKAMDPFKMLVENYAVPEYGSIDPTIFVAVAYLIMFGLMFGDAGQGLVILLIGLLGGKLMKSASAGVKKLLNLFIYCGSASIVTGILFGSYFGHQLFPALWFYYHGVVAGHEVTAGGVQNVYDILKITIFFGIAVIGTGLVLNWINLYRKKDYFNLFLNKSGIIGGWFYGCGIYTSFYFVGTGYKLLPAGNLLMIFFGIPVIILFFKAPLHFILYEREHKKFGVFSLIDFFMEWIVELLEIFSGYLSNTLSFMRVAGLGIAHVSLMSAFDTIAGMTSGGIAAVLILIVGNVLVIALEGLSAGIQALRLNYYEFFSRYFTGTGIAYNPVSLRNRKQEG